MVEIVRVMLCALLLVVSVVVGVAFAQSPSPSVPSFLDPLFSNTDLVPFPCPLFEGTDPVMCGKTTWPPLFLAAAARGAFDEARTLRRAEGPNITGAGAAGETYTTAFTLNDGTRFNLIQQRDVVYVIPFGL